MMRPMDITLPHSSNTIIVNPVLRITKSIRADKEVGGSVWSSRWRHGDRASSRPHGKMPKHGGTRPSDSPAPSSFRLRQADNRIDVLIGWRWCVCTASLFKSTMWADQAG